MKSLNSYITESIVNEAKRKTPDYVIRQAVETMLNDAKSVGVDLAKPEPHKFMYKPKDKDELRALIEELSCWRGDGPDADFNDIDVSGITDMSKLFMNWRFSGDISKWDVSKVTNMSYMFANSGNVCDISKWDVGNVKNMSYMFANCAFYCDLSNWNVSKVTNMSYMFYYTESWGKNREADLSKWNVSKVTNMSYMFAHAWFDGNISTWNVSKVKNMEGMFMYSSLSTRNGSLANWDVSKVQNFQLMFSNASAFDDNLNKWDVSGMANRFSARGIFGFTEMSRKNHEPHWWKKIHDNEF